METKEKTFVGFTVNDNKAKEINFAYVEFVLDTFNKQYTEILSYTVSKSELIGRWNITVKYI